MKTLSVDRFSSFKLRNKLFVNRVVVPPMASETGDVLGFVTKKTISHYEKLAQSGASLVMVEYTYVHHSGRSEEHQLSIHTLAHLPGLKKLAKVIQSRGQLAGIQLTHAGGKTEKNLTGGILQSPSSIRVPVKDKVLEVPTEMTTSDIQEWKKSFIQASKIAIQAGFDLIELHAAHGYGLNQWLSPLTNQRTDDYGGSLMKNARLLFEIAQEIRHLNSDILLAIRLPGQDFMQGGLSPQDSVEISKNLENIGVDIIDISSGIGGWRRPGQRHGEGYLVSEAAYIQSHISSPVIGVGGIETADYIDDVLKTKQIGLVAVGRAILNDPQAWGQKNLRRNR